MEIGNMVLLAVGLIVVIIGLAAFFNPNFARIINAPGGPRLKGIIALIIGIILCIMSFVVQFPT